MRTFLAFFLISTSASAICPDLAGHYICKNGSQVSQKIITQTDNGYIFNSDGIEFEYFTDGNVYDVPSSDNQKDGKVKSVCQDDKFIVDFTTTLLYEGSVIGKQVSKTEYSLSQDGFNIFHKSRIKGIPLPKVNIQCTKN